MSNVMGGVVLALVLAVSGSAIAQDTTKKPASPPVQAALSQHVAPRAATLNASGIQTIAARTGRNRRDIQVLSQYGTIYFGWPKNIAPATFDLEVGKGGVPTVRAANYTDADRARYMAALDAVLPEALKRAEEAKSLRQRPKP